MSDLSELFSRDPLELSDQDIDAIIIALRESRVKFMNGDKKAGSVKAEKAPPKPIDISDLGL
jgi:hypothetical protein